MKKMKRILAVILTAVFAFLMLTACSDGGAEPAKNDYGKMIESAMNAARREYSLPDVKFEASLESCAKNEANHSMNGWQYAEVGGKNYKIKHIDSGMIMEKGMTFETWKRKFEGYIKSSQSSTLGATFHGVADKDLTYIGLWTSVSNGQVSYCIVGAFPEVCIIT